jgi:hypothetical protein
MNDAYTKTNIHALSEIRTHGLSVQVINAYASDRAVTGTGSQTFKLTENNGPLISFDANIPSSWSYVVK